MTTQGVAFDYPELYNLVRAGKVFTATTAVTGVAPGTAIGTTAAFTLQNVAGSQVNLVVLEAAMGYVSGTLGAGVVNYLYNGPGTTAATGTAIALQCADLSGRAAAATTKAYTTATIVSPTLLKPFASLQASLASTAVAPWQIKDAVNGSIIVPPGANLSLHATAAAGTTPLVVFSMTFAEVSTES